MREAQAPPSRVGWPQAYPGSRMQLAGCAGERGLPEQAGKSPTVCGAGGTSGHVGWVSQEEQGTWSGGLLKHRALILGLGGVQAKVKVEVGSGAPSPGE